MYGNATTISTHFAAVTSMMGPCHQTGLFTSATKMEIEKPLQDIVASDILSI